MNRAIKFLEVGDRLVSNPAGQIVTVLRETERVVAVHIYGMTYRVPERAVLRNSRYAQFLLETKTT